MTAWQHGFRQVGAQLMPRASAFLRWWRDALLAWLPARWQWALGWAPARLLLRQCGDTLRMERDIGGETTLVGTLPWPCQPTALAAALEPRLQRLPRYWVLDAGEVLRRTLRVPAAATGRLRDVMGYEIDRQTPFAVDQVTYDVRVLGPPSGDHLQAELVVMPRQRLEQWQQAVGNWADAVSGIDVVDAAGAPLHVNLLPPGQRQRIRNPQLRLELLLAAAAAVMLMLAGNQLLHNRERAVDELRTDVERSARNARGVANERARLQTLVDGAAFLDSEHVKRPTMLALWNELSSLLPDGTYLEKIGVENQQVQLIGLSREANQLVPLLQASPLWQRVNLTGVLQADGTAGGRDRFTLTAELRPLATPLPAAKKEPAHAVRTDTP